MVSSPAIDAFLWEHLAAPLDPALQPGARYPEIQAPVRTSTEVIDVTPIREDEHLLPAGMFNHWPLDVLLHIDKPFIGLVVLIDIVTNHRNSAPSESVLESVTALAAGLLGGDDFGCRTIQNEFVLVYHGLQSGDAQRRLNCISERLWEHQQRQGTFSLLFSWGGLGTPGRPFSEAIASAAQRMNHMNRNRNVISMRSVNQRRKTV